MIVDKNKLIRDQKNIWSLYHNPIVLKSKEENEVVSQTEFVDTMDKYLLHLVEEVGEVLEYRRVDVEDFTILCEMLEEGCDVLLYIATIISMLKENLKNEIIDINVKKPYNMTTLYMDKILLITRLNLEVTLYVREFRKSFPHRKWHKEYEDFSDDLMKETVVHLLELSTNVFNLVYSMLCNYTDNEGLINKILKEKQGRVLNN